MPPLLRFAVPGFAAPTGTGKRLGTPFNIEDIASEIARWTLRIANQRRTIGQLRLISRNFSAHFKVFAALTEPVALIFKGIPAEKYLILFPEMGTDLFKGVVELSEQAGFSSTWETLCPECTSGQCELLNTPSLDLEEGNVGLPAVKAIAALMRHPDSELKTLDLSSNRVCDKGAKAIGEALRANGALTKLDLINNSFGGFTCSGAEGDTYTAGATVVFEGREYTVMRAETDRDYPVLGDPSGLKAIADALSVNGALTEIDLRDNKLGTESWRDIFNALRDNKENKIASWDLSDEEIDAEAAKAIAEYVADSRALTSLNVSFNGLDEEAALGIVRAVRKHDKMTNLGLAFCGIGPSGAGKIAEYVRVSGALTSLDLSYNKIDAKGAKAIGDALRVDRTLTSLNLSGNGIGEEDAEALTNGLRENETLKPISLIWD